VLGIHIGAPAIGSTTSPQRRMEGFQMMGMHLCDGKRLCGVGRLWIWSLVCGPFGAALRPLRPLVLAPHCAALAERLLGPPPLARPSDFAAQLHPEAPIASLASGQQRQIACLLDDVPPEPPRLFTPRAVFAAPVPLPNTTRRPIHPSHRPALGRVWGAVLVDPRVQRIPCDPLWPKLLRQGQQEEGVFTPLRRSGQR
jgi:hypothetical protein